MSSTILRRLCYVSRSLVDGEAGQRAAEHGRILDTARAANTRLGITGMLLVSEDCFAQILEGPPSAVDEVYGRIRQDRRHTAVTLLKDDPVADRAFGDWAMRFVECLSWPAFGTTGPMLLHSRILGMATRMGVA